jgi:Ca2+-binding EF-hand superfamily protein
MCKSLLLFAILGSAAASQPITVTGHAWAPFISPMGEPFRARSVTDDTLTRWFQIADRNHDGAITADELTADAERFFATLDVNHDGQIDPDELAQYEWEVAPEIQAMSKTRRAPGEAAPAVRRSDTDADPLQRGHGKVDQLDGSLGLGGALQGAARYGLLDMPEPVAASDTDFNRAISLGEFRNAAAERFRLLDSTHQGKLTLAQLEAIRSAQLDGAKAKHRGKVTDARIGNPLPAAP